MLGRRGVIGAGLAAGLAGVLAGLVLWRRPVAVADTVLPPPGGALRVYHLGHSLVGRDMPAMLAQLAGHGFASQLGWGASLRQHWGAEPVPGFEVENDHADHLPARQALESGAFDAVVLTEMVEIRDAIRWHDSATYLAHWAQAARAGNPAVRVYLYETWHRLDDPDGWLERIDADLERHWEEALRRPAQARAGAVHLIPAGQVLAAVVRAAEAGQVPGLTGRADLFARAEGGVDPIHLGDLGAYLVALAHYAVLYHRSPLGLPHVLRRADGSPAEALPDAAVPVVQALVWQVVGRHAATGLAPRPGL
ncbi:hypothetical protein RNZ50_20215 [Paracoccaceae bacterium Fryx2]|nr:hypothetical protein [Paracoccaceae bacterium Fryx2]